MACEAMEEEVARKLIEKKCNLDLQDGWRFSKNEMHHLFIGEGRINRAYVCIGTWPLWNCQGKFYHCNTILWKHIYEGDKLIELEKLILDNNECDCNLEDNDGSTAMSIAVESGHNEIGVMLYAKMHFNN